MRDSLASKKHSGKEVNILSGKQRKEPTEKNETETIPTLAAAQPNKAFESSNQGKFLTHFDRPTQTRMMAQFQKERGNHFVKRMIKSSQPEVFRQPQPPTAAAGPTAAVPAAPVVWKMPFGFGDAQNLTEARFGLLRMHDRLGELIGWVAESENQEVQNRQNQVMTLLRGLPQEGAISTTDRGVLNLLSTSTETYYSEKLRQGAERLISAVSEWMTVDTSVQQEMIDEALHNEYIRATPNLETLAKLKKLKESLNEYKEKADDIVTWGQRAAWMIGEAKSMAHIEAIEKKLGSVGKVLEKAGNMLQAAEIISELSAAAGKGGAEAGSLQAGIGQMRTAMKVADLAVGTIGKAVPVFGVLWSKYYKPLTEACLKLVEKIATIEDLQMRELQLFDWWEKNRKAGATPKIDPLFSKHFPGGQPVLDYMYPLVNGETPTMTPQVEEYFVNHKAIFNINQDEKDKIVTESTSHWYNPFSWGSPEKSPNLAGWLQKNRQTVWAQLYGKLPHTL